MCHFTPNSRPAVCRLLVQDHERLAIKHTRVLKFLTAYCHGGQTAFIDPYTGEMTEITPEVRAFAFAVINGPMSVGDEDAA